MISNTFKLLKIKCILIYLFNRFYSYTDNYHKLKPIKLYVQCNIILFLSVNKNSINSNMYYNNF